jgi:hypothetical protein
MTESFNPQAGILRQQSAMIHNSKALSFGGGLLVGPFLTLSYSIKPIAIFTLK